jgi:hypothetical protein
MVPRILTRIAIASLSVTIMSGCATDQKFWNAANSALGGAPANQPANYVNPLVPAVTTETDVFGLLGRPRKSLKLRDGRQVWLYRVGDLAQIHPLGAPQRILHLVNLLNSLIDYVKFEQHNGPKLCLSEGMGQASAPHLLTPVPLSQGLVDAQSCVEEEQERANELIPEIRELAARDVLIGFTPTGKFIKYVIVR